MEQGPAVPAYVLRGHESPVHALRFCSSNALLASGDGDGWMVIWRLSSKRPVAVWKGHSEGVVAIHWWMDQRLVSHGRDHRLRVWQIRPEDFARLSAKLPTDGASGSADQPQPWLLHSMAVGALNFCTFSMCDADADTAPASSTEPPPPPPQLMATPNGLDPGGIDIFQLPSEHRVSQIHSDQAEVTTGMVMAVNLFHNTDSLVLISGYEDGRVMVHRHRGEMGLDGHWELITTIKSHTQPVLSLDVLPSKQHFIASGADATVARFSLTLAGSPRGAKLEKAVNTKHAGQQGLTVRSDGKIFATAGWDCRVRVYATKTLKELAVLKWHKVGCYTTAFANITPTSTSASASGTGAPANMSDEIVSSHTALDLIKRQREDKAQSTHWLAAGGKDGKISLWDIY